MYINNVGHRHIQAGNSNLEGAKAQKDELLSEAHQLKDELSGGGTDCRQSGNNQVAQKRDVINKVISRIQLDVNNGRYNPVEIKESLVASLKQFGQQIENLAQKVNLFVDKTAMLAKHDTNSNTNINWFGIANNTKHIDLLLNRRKYDGYSIEQAIIGASTTITTSTNDEPQRIGSSILPNATAQNNMGEVARNVIGNAIIGRVTIPTDDRRQRIALPILRNAFGHSIVDGQGALSFDETFGYMRLTNANGSNWGGIWRIDISRYTTITRNMFQYADKIIISQEVLLDRTSLRQILDIAIDNEIAITLLVDTRTPVGLHFTTITEQDYTLAQLFDVIDLNPNTHQGLNTLDEIIRQNRSYPDGVFSDYYGIFEDIIGRVQMNNEVQRNNRVQRNNGVQEDNIPIVLGNAYEVHNTDHIYNELTAFVKLPPIPDKCQIQQHWDKFCEFVENGDFGYKSDSAKNLFSNINNGNYPEITSSVKDVVAQVMEYCGEDKYLLSVYVINFLTDAATAYDNRGTSCTNGILERAKFSLYNIYMINTQDESVKPYMDALKLFLAISDLPHDISKKLTIAQNVGFNNITGVIQKAFENDQVKTYLTVLIQNKGLSEAAVKESVEYIIKEEILPNLKDRPSIINLVAESILSRERVVKFIGEYLQALSD